MQNCLENWSHSDGPREILTLRAHLSFVVFLKILIVHIHVIWSLVIRIHLLLNSLKCEHWGGMSGKKARVRLRNEVHKLFGMITLLHLSSYVWIEVKLIEI